MADQQQHSAPSAQLHPNEIILVDALGAIKRDAFYFINLAAGAGRPWSDAVAAQIARQRAAFGVTNYATAVEQLRGKGVVLPSAAPQESLS